MTTAHQDPTVVRWLRRGRAAVKRSVLPLVLALGMTLAVAASQNPSAVKAAFLYKFGAFVEWPHHAFENADDALVIGVLGDDAVAGDLAQLVQGRSVGGRPVRALRLPEGGPVTGVHILFLGRQLSAPRLREAAASAPGPVLVVTDQPRGSEAAGTINFFIDEGRVRFSTSVALADARSLKLSARLLAVAQPADASASPP